VRSNAQRRENTVIPKLITRENIPRRRKRIPLNMPNPMGKPRRIEPSSLFCPFVTIYNIIPRTNACKKILSSNLFPHNNYETFYPCRITLRIRRPRASSTEFDKHSKLEIAIILQKTMPNALGSPVCAC